MVKKHAWGVAARQGMREGGEEIDQGRCIGGEKLVSERYILHLVVAHRKISIMCVW